MIRHQVDPFGGGGAPPGGAPDMISIPGGGGGPNGPPSEPPPEAPSLEDAAKQALQALNAALAGPDVDPEEANFAEAATSALTKIIATNQKNSDAAMGTTPAHKAVRKATKRAAAGGGY